MSTTQVVVGRIGKPHGVRGEVSVEPRTDEPDRRFVDDTVFAVQTPSGETPAGGRPSRLRLRSSRWHQSRLLVTFAEVPDRDAAEAVRGLLLLAEVDLAETPENPEEFYDHQLVGLAVLTTDGDPVGELVEVVHGTGQDLLSVRAEDGREVLVPFVSALVPTVDLAGGRLLVEDRPGLLNPAVEDEQGGA